MQHAATKSGRSLSQEVEHRLRRSFDEDRDLFERFGGRQNYSLLRLVGASLATSINPNDSSATWLDDPYAFDQALQSVVAVLEAFRPPGDPEFKDSNSPMMEAAAAIQGVERATRELQRLASWSDHLMIDPSGKIDVSAAIKDGLGPLTERLRFVRGNAKGLRALADQMERAEKTKTKRGGNK